VSIKKNRRFLRISSAFGVDEGLGLRIPHLRYET
jgi:hypothetical protein